MRTFKKAAVVFVFSVLTVSVFVEVMTAQTPPTTLATVDGQPITAQDLYTALVHLYPQQATETLNQLVNEILISNEARRKRISVSEQEIAARAQEIGLTADALSDVVRRTLKTSLLAEKMLVEEKKLRVTPDEVNRFFQENKEQLGEPEQVRIRQIFVLNEQDANNITLALSAGADFSRMAQLKSQDAASKDRGGDLGFFSRGTLVPEIERAAFAMEAGGISSAIRTQAGFHIIKVEEKRPAREAKLDGAMRKRLERTLLNDKIQQELPAWLEGLRAKAEIR